MIKKILIGLLCLCVMGAAVACGSKSDDQKSLGADEMATKMMGDYITDESKMIALTQEQMEQFYGVTKDSVEECAIYLSENNLNCNEIAVAIPKKDKKEEVYNLFLERLEKQKKDFENYLPEQFAILENAEVVKSGEYVVLAAGEFSKEMMETFDAEK